MGRPDSTAPTREVVTAALAARGLKLSLWQPLSGDVSPRRYVRVAIDGVGGAILALYPEEIRSVCSRFLATSSLLAAAGVPAPGILAADCESGWMLLEDAGPATLAERSDLSWPLRLPYYEEALEQIARIALLPGERVAEINPPLGAEILERELRQTWDLYLVPSGLLDDHGFAAALWQLFVELSALVGAGPLVPCHRDFMARNLMPLGGQSRPSLVVLDHQDLRLGPAAYDLASLLNDTLFPPPELEERLLEMAGWDAGCRRLDYHRAAAQRSLKAVGTYASFSRQGADRHLPLVPPTLRRALEHLCLLPEAAPLSAGLSRLREGVSIHAAAPPFKTDLLD